MVRCLLLLAIIQVINVLASFPNTITLSPHCNLSCNQPCSIVVFQILHTNWWAVISDMGRSGTNASLLVVDEHKKLSCNHVHT